MKKKEIIERLDRAISLLESIKPVHQDTLITSGEVLRRLNIGAKDRAWGKIKEVLITKYGMSRTEGTGYRMTERQLARFINDNYNNV